MFGTGPRQGIFYLGAGGTRDFNEREKQRSKEALRDLSQRIGRCAREFG